MDEDPEEDPGIGKESVNATGGEDDESEEEPFKGVGTGFLKLPADVDPHEALPLQDADVSQETREWFDALCQEFEDIFSKDSADLGKMPLVRFIWSCSAAVGSQVWLRLCSAVGKSWQTSGTDDLSIGSYVCFL